MTLTAPIDSNFVLSAPPRSAEARTPHTEWTAQMFMRMVQQQAELLQQQAAMLEAFRRLETMLQPVAEYCRSDGFLPSHDPDDQDDRNEQEQTG